MKNQTWGAKLSDIVKKYEDQLPGDVVKEIKENIEYNELGLAFDDFCNMAFENDVKIEKTDFNQIENIGNAYGLSASTWSFLRKP